MNINHISLARHSVKSFGIAEENIPEALHIIDKLDKESEESVAGQLMKLNPSKSYEEVLEQIKSLNFTGSIEDLEKDPTWDEEAKTGYEELTQLFTIMRALGAKDSQMVFNARMVRGLDYYTGVVAETFFKDIAGGSIASGGRYDNLVGIYNPKFADMQGVGISIGVTRIFDILTKKGLVEPKQQSVAHVMVGFRSKEQLNKAVVIAAKLREKGYNVDLFCGAKPRIKKQLNYGNKQNIPFAILVMAEESIVVRNLITSEQEDLKSDETAFAAFEKMKEVTI